MDPLVFTYLRVMETVYRMVQKLPAPNACTDEELDELWNNLLDEYNRISEYIDNSISTEGAETWKQQLGCVEKDLEAVEYEWLRRRPQEIISD
jgi:hypothetical protein